MSGNLAEGGDAGESDIVAAGSSKGGGVFLFGGDLTLASSVMSGNVARGGNADSSFSSGQAGRAEGGGLHLPHGNHAILDSVLSSNLATGGDSSDDDGGTGQGGGIRVFTGGTLSIVRSAIQGNSVTGGDGSFQGGDARGAGLYQTGFGAQLDFVETTISGNSAVAGIGSGNGDARGGGLYSRLGTLALTQSTVSGNNAAAGDPIEDNGGSAFGGGIATGSTIVSVQYSTIANNKAEPLGSSSGRGGGIYRGSSFGSINLSHTIVADNTAPTAPDVSSSSISASFSLIENPSGTAISGSGNKTGMDPLLGPLANYGGPTLTHALLPGSPAINAGDAAAVAGSGNVPLNDQRGAPFTRVFDGRIDIGAFEVRPVPAADFDFDLDVDGSDFLAWQRGFGTQAPNASQSDGDADGDTDVDGADLTVWENLFGTVVAPVAASQAAPIASPLASSEPLVPELIDAALAFDLFAREREVLGYEQDKFIRYEINADDYWFSSSYGNDFALEQSGPETGKDEDLVSHQLLQGEANESRIQKLSTEISESDELI